MAPRLRGVIDLLRVLGHGRRGFVLGQRDAHGPVEDGQGEDEHHGKIDPVGKEVPGSGPVATDRAEEDVAPEPWGDPEGVARRPMRAGAASRGSDRDLREPEEHGQRQLPRRLEATPVDDQVRRTERGREQDAGHGHPVGTWPAAIHAVKGCK